MYKQKKREEKGKDRKEAPQKMYVERERQGKRPHTIEPKGKEKEKNKQKLQTTLAVRHEQRPTTKRGA